MTFTNFMNDAPSPHLDNFATAYLDDILIYSINLQEHQDHVKKIPAALTKQGLHLKPDKCCHGPEAHKVPEGGGSRLSGPTGTRGGEGGGSR